MNSTRRLFVSLMIISSAVHVITTRNVTQTNQNSCIIKHMLKTYTPNDELTLANMEQLFDAVTTGYHEKLPPHLKGTAPVRVKSNTHSGRRSHVMGDTATVYRASDNILTCIHTSTTVHAINCILRFCQKINFRTI